MTPTSAHQIAPRARRTLLFWRRDPIADVQDEVQFHMDSLIDEQLAAGVDLATAREIAIGRFGDVADITRVLNQLSTERDRRMRVKERIEVIGQDCRIAIRQLVRSPAFTIVATLTMALGIGANTAIFSVLYNVVIRPLPFANADRLVVLRERNGTSDTEGMAVTVGNYATWTRESREFSSFGAYFFGSYTLTGNGDPQRLSAVLATASFWKTLSIPPALGRYYTDAEDAPGAQRVAVLSNSLWRSTFGGDSSVLGRAILLNGEPYTVVGVAAAEYGLTPRSGSLWVPLAFGPGDLAEHADHELTVIGLTRPGTTVRAAVAELTRIETALAAQYPHSNFDGGIVARSERDTIVGSAQAMLVIVAGAVALVLLIACVNVANLLLGRAAARKAEMALRAALGAGRGRLVGQVLTESMLLALSGAIVGLLLAEAAVQYLVHTAPPLVPRLADVSLNLPVVGYAAGLAVLCGLMFGLLPALRQSKVDLQGALREGARGASGHGRDRVRAALVVAEVALSLILLVGAGLCVRSGIMVQRVSPGFDTNNLLVASVALPAARYRSDTATTLAFGEIISAIRSVPGVESASFISRMPIATSGADCGVRIAGTPPMGDKDVGANVRVVDESYFETMRTPRVRGRTFSAGDRSGTAAVVILTAGLAHQIFGNTDPIGQRVAGCSGDAKGEEVVGIVGDVRARGVRDGIINEIYYPESQAPQRSMWIAVRGTVPVTSLTTAIRKAVATVDPQLPLAGLATMDDVVKRSLATPRFITTLLVLLGAVGFILAAVGIYGVISYLVAQRTHEIGVRMALGAGGGRIVRLVVGQGVMLAIVGIAIGAAVSRLATRVVGDLLFGVTASDPVTFVGVSVMLIVVAAIASFVPAWRASRVDPVVALRAESA